jgi:hypothetical protein
MKFQGTYKLLGTPTGPNPTATATAMKATQQLAVHAVLVLLSGHALGQTTPCSATIKTPTTAAQHWEYTLTTEALTIGVT